MQLKTLKLTNFRNHIKAEFSFPGVTTFIVGQNAAGKTNILEAIYLLSTAKSLRGSFEQEIISEGVNHARVVGEIEREGREFLLEIFLEKREGNYSTKKLWVNKVARSITDFGGILLMVVFLPEHIGLFTGTPKNRRSSLDLICTQYSSDYRMALRSYEKVVRQRNSLIDSIRETGRGRDTLSYWNEQLVATGEVVQSQREDFIDYLDTYLSTHVRNIDASAKSIKVEYLKSELSLNRLKEIQERELAAGKTLIGPHRDDLRFFLNDRDLSSFGSRGEQRSVLLLWKMAEISFLKEQTGEEPILLLDDIFSEFDETHRESVLHLLGNQQTIVTTTDINRIDGGEVEGEIIYVK